MASFFLDFFDARNDVIFGLLILEPDIIAQDRGIFPPAIIRKSFSNSDLSIKSVAQTIAQQRKRKHH